MTFGLKSFGSFGKLPNLFGNGGLLGGGHDSHTAGGLFGGQTGGGLFGGHTGGGLFGGHSGGGLFGGHAGGGLFGNIGGGKDCDTDNDHDAGHGHGSDGGAGSGSGGGSGGATQGTGWPDIPSDTAGITFHVDYDADGAMDNYIPVGRDSDTNTFEDYLAKARDQVATDNPDVDPKDVIVKATITTASGSETYYNFTGMEDDGPTDGPDEENDGDADDDSANNCGSNGGDHHSNDDDHASHDDSGDHGHACGDHAADFFKSLMGGFLSFDHGHDDDRWDDHEEDDHHGHHDFDFC